MPSRSFRVSGRAVVATITLLMAAGCSGGSGSSDHTAESDEAGWRVDSCVRQVSGPERIPPDVTGDERLVLEARQQFEPVACDDEQAVARITDIGADIELGRDVTDDGCPDDTDAAYKAPDPVTGRDSHVVCARYLEPPHPGDPGGGGGHYVAGDCLFVASSPGALNDQLTEMACDLDGWFGTIVSLAPSPDACPPEALSRLAVPGRPGEVLCLAPDSASASGGTMVAPGDCMLYESVASLLPPRPTTDCDEFEAYRLEAFADASGTCPAGGEARPVTGYDREICLG
jgi:hypothetical protein